MTRKTEFAGCDLSSRNLRGRDLTRQILAGTDLRGSKLHGCMISIDCATFEGLKLDDHQMCQFLLLLAQTDSNQGIRDGLLWVARNVMGDEWVDRMLIVMQVTG